MENLIYEGFIAAIRDIVDTTILQQITEAVEAGDFETVWRLLGVMPGSMRPLTLAIEQSFEDAARQIASEYPKVLHTPDGKGVFRFNVANPRAQEWLRTTSGRLVSNITEDTRISVRNAMDAGLAAGRNPRTVALDIVGRYDRSEGHRVGGVIGLTPQQQGWVESARRRLTQAHMGGADQYLEMTLRDRRFDSVVAKARDSGKALTKEQVDRLVTRYADRTLRYRGETIARYESMTALAAADYESTKQVVEMGAAREKDITREWDTAGDKAVRSSHRAMDGKKVGFDEPFVLPSGDRMMFPRDDSLGANASERVKCRCIVKTHIDWIGAAIRD